MCASLLICFNFSPEMDYTNNEEFVEDITACTLHLNSMEEDHNRIPVDLVVAQAIHESEWGRSRFAVEGNNLMGIRTFDSADDQMKPINIPNSSWGLRIFETSVNPYPTIWIC